MLAAPILTSASETFNEVAQALTPTQTAFTIASLSLFSSTPLYTSKDVFEASSSSPNAGFTFDHHWTSRESHNYPNSPYCLPADGHEKLRLDKQHNFIRDHICGGCLILDDTLTLKEGAIVLDLGTGSGAWASDMAGYVPAGVKIQGFDISNRLFPPNSHNLTFATGNVLDLPAHLQSRVSLAHQRLLIYALRRQEWSHAITSIKNTLIPGEGVIQLTEVLTPTDNPGAAQEKFQVMLSSIGRKRQLLLDCGEHLPALLDQAGFMHIAKKAIKVRLGSAGGVKGLKAAACRIGAFRGMRDSVLLDGGYGIVSSPEEFDELLDGVMAEWETNECYATYYNITARRPASSFTAPPWSLSMPEIFDFHTKNNGHLPFYRYAHDNALHNISYSTLAAAIQRAAKLVLAAAGEGDSPVAVLAVADAITFITTMLGFFRAGIKAFFISPRNSTAATSHLLQKAGSQCLLVSSDEGMQQLAKAAINQDKLAISIKPMPTYEQLFKAPEEASVPLLESYDLDSVALILHSSGSTNFPKPISLTHRNLIEWGRGAHGERNFEGEILGGHSLAFFHAMGVIAPLWCACSGMQLAVFPPVSPPIRPTSENVYNGIVDSQSTYVFCVPSHIERWAGMMETHEHLAKQIKALAYCGAPLGADAGNLLSSKGVNLQPYFASTETGGMSLFLPKHRSSPQNRGWAHFLVAPHCNVRVVQRPNDSVKEEDGLSELVFLKGPHHTPSVFNTIFEGEPAYTTGDLVVSNRLDGVQYFRFYAREDDQLLLSTGEKTNPVPIEKILLKDDNIDLVVLFGDGKQQNGALVQPSASYRSFEEAAGLLSSDEKLARFRRTIAAALAAANEFAPSHSFIFPELVLIADHPFQLTGKGTVRRRHTLSEFAEQIEHAYTEVERSTLPNLRGPAAGAWTINNTLDFVSAVVRKIVGQVVPVNEDIFDHGADSLQETWIRNTILRVLREAGFVTRKIPSDFVFQFPSIQQLAAFLFGLSFTGSASSSSDTPEEAEEAQTMVWPELGRVGETIVKLRDGENPLIIIHGAGGTIHAFPPLQEKFRSGLWAIQVTPDTPLDSMENLVSFYHAAIKREQPQGPYRLSAFSATSIVALALAKRIEAEGSVVAQLAMLDHVPGFYACPVYGIDKSTLSDPAHLHDFHRICCEGICDLLRRDGGGRVPRRHQLAQELSDAFAGKPHVPAFSMTYWRTVEHFLNLLIDFMLRDDFTGVAASADDSALSSFMEWQRALKAPVSLYIAQDGMKKSIPKSFQAEWADLGVRRSWPDARIYDIPGGHFDILGNDQLVELLQNEWK